MYIFLSILFITVIFLSFVEDKISSSAKCVLLIILTFSMTCMSALKDIDHTADARSYLMYFLNNEDPLIEIMTEPTFIYISRLIILLGGGITALFLIYSLITIPLKLFLFNKLVPHIFTTLIIYIPVYFALHDIVQIRAGAACSFLLLCIYFRCTSRFFPALLAWIMGVLFHYSSIVFLPILLWGNHDLNIYVRYIMASVVPIGFAMYFLKINLLNILPDSFIAGKIDFYKEMAETGSGWEDFVVPYKNLYLLAKCTLLLLCLIFYKTIKKSYPYTNVMLVMLSASIFTNLSLIQIPVLAGRISDLYGITDAISFSFGLTIIKPSWVVKIGISLIGLYMLYYNYQHAGYFI